MIEIESEKRERGGERERGRGCFGRFGCQQSVMKENPGIFFTWLAISPNESSAQMKPLAQAGIFFSFQRASTDF